MTNIPTDLLRTLIAVVDLRGYTKAATSLGVTQPAVSAQIKRLQFLLGGELFDRSGQGFTLTPHGEAVVSFARRMLAINDQIVALNGAAPQKELVIRVGTPSDYVASMLPDTLVRLRARWPDVRFSVRTTFYDALMRELRAGDVDVVVALSMTRPHEARYFAEQEVVWVRGDTTRFDPGRPVPLVSYGEPCIYHRHAVKTLRAAGLDWEPVFTGPSLNSLCNAVIAGLGVMAITRGRANTLGMAVWEDAPLPKLRDLYSGIYVREGGARAAYEQLAAEMDKIIHKPLAKQGAGRSSLKTVRAGTSAA
jgi:DNA-binding transcriptional LysR family regulator